MLSITGFALKIDLFYVAAHTSIIVGRFEGRELKKRDSNYKRAKLVVQLLFN